MKLLVLSYLSLILTSCNVYNSEPREFITKSGVLQSDGKIVINSTDKIETSYCFIQGSYKPEGANELIDSGIFDNKGYSIYQLDSKKLQVIMNSSQGELTCNFNLITNHSEELPLKYLLDLSSDALETTY